MNSIDEIEKPAKINASVLEGLILRQLPFVPVPGQSDLVKRLARFVCEPMERPMFVLDGHAGTGKTSMLAAFVRGLASAGIHTVLLAPTGRAAKVFSSFAGSKAVTIHKRLYRADNAAPGEKRFFLAPNRDTHTVFIADEASMISDSSDMRRSLLRMLVSHVYSSVGCRLILVGDRAQLPPVGQSESPAMNVALLKSLGFEPWAFMLDETVRQSASSGILYNANLVLRQILHPGKTSFRMKVSGFSDIEAISPRDLEDYLTSSWSRVGQAETLIITRSNWRANRINAEVRNRILYADTALQRGEQVLVTKNNYYWTRNSREFDFIANGETAIVEWMGRTHEMYGFMFADAELSFPGKAEPVAAKLMLSSLQSEGASVSDETMAAFYNRLMAEAEGELTEKMRYADSNEYYNALQIKYSYCVTCHKAQGGQWKHVYVDMGSIAADAMCEDFYRWLYTAVTRATEHVYLVNPTVPVV